LDEYADDSHACREFRRFTGMTIGEYRAAKAGGDGLVNGARRALVD
jgi:AraC-like DNA-binding protein